VGEWTFKLRLARNEASWAATDYPKGTMGLEAECTVRLGRKKHTGTAMLDAESLAFRGDIELKLAFEAIRSVHVEGDELVAASGDQEARFELGKSVAERWTKLIKIPRELFEKLEVGPSSHVAVVDIADPVLITGLRERTASVSEGRVAPGTPVIFFGAETRDALRKILLLRARLTDTGVLWLVLPKGPKAIAEADVIHAVREASLVETKVVPVSRTHVARKCVIPPEFQGKPARRPPIVSLPPPAPKASSTDERAAAKK
jgi:hypothetical protein